MLCIIIIIKSKSQCKDLNANDLSDKACEHFCVLIVFLHSWFECKYT